MGELLFISGVLLFVTAYAGHAMRADARDHRCRIDWVPPSTFVHRLDRPGLPAAQQRRQYRPRTTTVHRRGGRR